MAGANDFIIPSAKAQKEQRQFFKADDEQRSSSATLLTPDEVAGEYDAGRLLMTTIGGQPRMLTIDDLRTFQQNIRLTKGKYKKGITAKSVIDLSWASDRQRANEEIRNATPISVTGDLVKFMTNAGPKSDRTRHYVQVRFLNLEAVASSAIKTEKTGAEVAKGHLHISCSCGRWRYWLAYVASIGGYNSGHPETAYPKIRNPGLTGVACKHVLRVMTLIHQSPATKAYLTSIVKRMRDTTERKRADTKIADARELADKIKKESYRQRRVATTEEKRAERARWAKSKPVQDLMAKQAEKMAKAKATAVSATARALEANIQKMLALGAINQTQADAMRAAMKG